MEEQPLAMQERVKQMSNIKYTPVKIKEAAAPLHVVEMRINTRGDIDYKPIEDNLSVEQMNRLNKLYNNNIKKSKSKSKLKKYGKFGLYAFIAYQVVGLIFLAFNFENIMNESTKIGQSIAQDMVGNK
jgi:hypothetical protein